MRVIPFPSCCTARIIIGFGEILTADHSALVAYNEHRALSFQQKLEWLKNQLKSTVVGVFFATTTSNQKEGIKLLTEAGFTSTKLGQKDQHREGDLIGWTYVTKPREEKKAKDIAEAFVVPRAIRAARERLANGRFAPKPLYRIPDEANNGVWGRHPDGPWTVERLIAYYMRGSRFPNQVPLEGWTVDRQGAIDLAVGYRHLIPN